MSLPDLPVTAFVDPFGRNRDEVERLARQVLDLLLDTLATAAERSPMPEPRSLPEPLAIPDDPVPEAAILAGLRTLLDDSMNTASPGFIGHMDPIPATISFLGELASAGINNNMFTLEMSPVFSRLERSLLETLGQRFGLGERSGGVMTSGGGLANLQALAVARNLAFDARARGIRDTGRQPVILASEVAHMSLQKATMLLGLGTDAVLPVATDADSRMNPEALRRGIAVARADGQAPFCVVATAGTTTTGNIDPLAEIAAIAHDENLWFHVDAAYGGAAIFSPRHHRRLAGIEQADSITFNPQKWLYVAKTCAMALFRDTRQLEDAFRIPASYTRETAGFVNLGEIGVQGTRHADVLKLWLTLQQLGARGLAALVDDGYRRTERLAAEIERRPFLQLASRPDTNIVCFRGLPPAGDGDAADRWNGEMQERLLREDNIFLSLPRYRDRLWLRAILLNPYTGDDTLGRLFARIDGFASQA